MYIGGDENREYYQRKKEAHRKVVKKHHRKKFFAALTLFVCVCFFAAVLGFAGWGIKTLITKHGISGGSDYVEEKASVPLTLVNNVFTETSDISEKVNFTENNDIEENKTETITTPVKKGLVIVDAGHGGMDSGTFSGDVLEKDLNLSIAFWVKEELENKGYDVYMTRTGDDFVGLQERANIANSLESPKCLVSVHQNFCDDAVEPSGVESWTYDRSGCEELGNALTAAAAETTGARNRGTQFRTNLVVTSKTTMPAVIFECGYLSNPDETAKLTTEEYQVLMARGIANGVEKFIESYY